MRLMPARPGEFYSKTQAARKIIVVELGYLGDSIHLTPALWDIKRNYPNAELHVAATPLGCELLSMAPCVDRLWPLKRTPGGTPLGEQLRWLREVRRQHFDVAFNFSGTDRTVILTYLSGARHRVALACGRRHFWNSWLIPLWLHRPNRTTYVSEQKRQVLEACGLTLGPLRYDYRLPDNARAWAEKTIPSGAIHISVNAGHALKEWPLDRWIGFAKALLAQRGDLKLVATGTSGKRDRRRLEAFADAVHDPRLQVFSGNLSLAQLAALLARCSLHVGADSGALHLAVVMGVPTVSIFREYEGIHEWLPRGAEHQHVAAACRCVNQKVQPCQASGHPECLAGISVETVLGMVERRMNTLPAD